MFAWKPQATGHLALGEPSPLLSHIAGEFASQIAGLWPKPHAVFLTTDAPRRHLLCLRLALARDGEAPLVLDKIVHGALKAAIAAALPDAPTGLKRALEHMGERAWPRAAYLRLLDMLAHPQAAKVLRHAQLIEASQIDALDALPRPMLQAGAARLGFDIHQARLVAEVFDALAARDGPDAATQACQRWSAAACAKDTLGLIEQDLTPQLPPPPFVGSAHLRPLRTSQEIRDAALRYRNCLRYQVSAAARGNAAFYEWLGEPRTVLRINRDDLFGWRLDEARILDNEAVPEPARRAICAELRAMGVHVGRGDWQLRELLEEAAQPRFVLPPHEATMDYVFTP